MAHGETPRLATPSALPSPATSLKARTLIIEDNPDDVLLAVETLRDYGFEIEYAECSDLESLRALLNVGWDAVLTDYNLPHLTAEEALEIVREHDQDLPFILVSGTVELGVAVEMMRSGASDYVLKNRLDRLGPALERSIRERDARRTEKAVRDELITLQQSFREALEQSAVGITMVDLEGRYTWVNRKFCEIVAREPEELVGTPFSDITWPDDLSQDLGAFRRALAGEISEVRRTKRYLRGDGSPVWVDLTATTIRRPNGTLSHMSTIVQDITEKKLAENRYRTIVETMAEGLYTLDQQNRFTFANQRFCAIVGYELDEMEGVDIVELLAYPEDRPMLAVMGERRRQGISDQYESRLRHKNGSQVDILISASPLQDANGSIAGKLCVVNDITENKRRDAEQVQLRAQLDRLNRIESLGKLAGTMAHEFNNVLMGVQPFTEVIRLTAQRCGASAGNCGHQIERATQNILRAVQRGQRISAEVLRFARPAHPRREWVDSAEFLEETRAAAASLISSPHSLAVVDEIDAMSLHVDREQLLQVFSNLVINARDAMPNGGEISVTLTRDDSGTSYSFGVVQEPERYAHFVVADQGCGIPKEMQKQIFEPLVTTKRNGTGLGLAVSHQIVTSHDGLIFVESEEGSGTRMHLFIPATKEP